MRASWVVHGTEMLDYLSAHASIPAVELRDFIPAEIEPK
jgi:hypothetical protein